MVQPSPISDTETSPPSGRRLTSRITRNPPPHGAEIRDVLTSAHTERDLAEMMELQGQRALITGGASGIGEACARLFAAAGALVTIADVNVEAANELADELGGTAWQVDL